MTAADEMKMKAMRSNYDHWLAMMEGGGWKKRTFPDYHARQMAQGAAFCGVGGWKAAYDKYHAEAEKWLAYAFRWAVPTDGPWPNRAK